MKCLTANNQTTRVDIFSFYVPQKALEMISGKTVLCTRTAPVHGVKNMLCRINKIFFSNEFTHLETIVAITATNQFEKNDP